MLDPLYITYLQNCWHQSRESINAGFPGVIP